MVAKRLQAMRPCHLDHGCYACDLCALRLELDWTAGMLALHNGDTAEASAIAKRLPERVSRDFNQSPGGRAEMEIRVLLAELAAAEDDAGTRGLLLLQLRALTGISLEPAEV